MSGRVGLKREGRLLTTTTARWLGDTSEGSSCSLFWTSCGKSVRSPAFRRKRRMQIHSVTVRSPAFRPQASDADPFRDAKRFRLKAGLRTALFIFTNCSILPRSKPNSHHLIAHKRIDARVGPAKDVGPIVGREHRGKHLHAR